MRNFIGGVFVGGIIGFFVIALCKILSKNDEYGNIIKNGDNL